jgi:DNA invertase Pin-like site-specific DNA recombinase
VNKAYSYVRMSTTQQLMGDSLRRQTEKARDYARSNGLDLDEGFKLHDIGLSAFDGTNLDKGTLGQFLASVKLGKVLPGSTLIIESLDRLSRQNPRKALPLFLEILNAGITIVTLTDGRRFEPESTDPLDLMIAIMVMARANEESATKSFRIRQAWSKKRDRAGTEKLSALCPSWLRKSGNAFEVLEERADIVRHIFHRCTALGEGAFKITHHLNAERVPTFSDRTDIWSISTVKKILASCSVYGDFTPHTKTDGKRVPTDVTVQGYFPQIVTRDIFDMAQHQIGQRRIAGGGRKGLCFPNLFAKIATCAYCQRPMHMGDKGNGKFLICSGYANGTDCPGGKWKYDEFERLILTHVRDIDPCLFAIDDSQSNATDTLSARTMALKGRLADLRQKRDRAFDLATADQASDFIRQKMMDLDKDVRTTEGQLADMEAEGVRLAAEKVNTSTRGLEVSQLIDALQVKGIEQTTVLRARIHSALRDLITSIAVSPSGTAMSVDTPPNVGQSHPENTARTTTTTIMDPNRRRLLVTLKNGRRWEISTAITDDGVGLMLSDPTGAVVDADDIMRAALDTDQDLDQGDGYVQAYSTALERRRAQVRDYEHGTDDEGLD